MPSTMLVVIRFTVSLVLALTLPVILIGIGILVAARRNDQAGTLVGK